jgi:hypothetical protein
MDSLAKTVTQSPGEPLESCQGDATRSSDKNGTVTMVQLHLRDPMVLLQKPQLVVLADAETEEAAAEAAMAASENAR